MTGVPPPCARHGGACRKRRQGSRQIRQPTGGGEGLSRGLPRCRLYPKRVRCVVDRSVWPQRPHAPPRCAVQCQRLLLCPVRARSTTGATTVTTGRARRTTVPTHGTRTSTRTTRTRTIGTTRTTGLRCACLPRKLPGFACPALSSFRPARPPRIIFRPPCVLFRFTP